MERRGLKCEGKSMNDSDKGEELRQRGNRIHTKVSIRKKGEKENMKNEKGTKEDEIVKRAAC